MDITTLLATFNAVSGRAADMAVAALWQGALVAGALTLCLRMAPRVSAAYRFALWATAFVALAGLSVFSLMPQLSAGATGAMAARISENVARPWLSVDARWSVAIAVLWLAASLFRAMDLAVHSLRLRKLWKDATPILLDERVEALLAAASADYGRGPVEVCTTNSLQRPSVIGFFKPRILIPDWLFGRLTQGELEQIVLHEAEHLRRRDDWTNLAQKLCLVLFPLNPALIWIERRLCREREMACDEGVIRVTRAPRAYAACLASLAERGLERQVEALSLGAWQRRPELVHRVHSILRSKGKLSPMSARVLLGTLGCGLLAGSVELAQSPRLVAFVPARSAIAVQNSNAAKASTENPVQAASVEIQKSVPHTIHAVPSKTSARGDSITDAPGAMNVTLREPDRSRNMAVPLMAKAGRGDAANRADAAKSSDSANADSKNQQWIVLTEWQQVETSGDTAGLRRDYEADAQNDNVPTSTDQGSQITVTQLIFKIMPANAEMHATPRKPANAGSKSTTKPAASSSKSQPGFATFRDGWLVLQL